MEPILGLLFVAGVLWAGKHAAEHVAREFRASRAKHAKAGPLRPARRRHAAAWWAREIRHGFPVTRAGFSEGWQAHQTAMEQHRARREEGRTSHLEARASIAEEMRRHWARQEAALDRVDRVLDGAHPDDELAPKRAGKTTPPLPADTVQPPASAPAQAPTPQEGNGHMATATETNYTTVLNAAKSQAAQADATAADVRAQRQAAEQILEDMAAVEVDPATQSDQADLVAALKAAETALDAVTESGETVSSATQRRHGGLKEAHDDAPVRAADREFYEGD